MPDKYQLKEISSIKYRKRTELSVIFKVTLFIAAVIWFLPSQCFAEPDKPTELVKFFDRAYGTYLMDEIADITTPKFRENKPKSVWVMETWKALKKIKYERLGSSIIKTKVKDNRAVVILQASIRAIAGEVDQKEIYYLVKDGDKWLIDQLIVTEEEIDTDKLEL